MSEGNGRSWSPEVRDMGDRIAALTVAKAVELGDYLEEVHKIKPAASAVAVAAAPTTSGAPAAEKKEEQTEFTVQLDGIDPAANRVNVIKVVREITGLGLKESKELVEGAPKPVKENVSKEEAEKLKKKLEESGAKVSLK